MATASIPGFRATFFIASSSGGGNPSSSGAALVKLGELAEITLTVAQGSMEATSKDSNAWREYLAGLREWSLTGSGMYLMETTDPGQQAIWTGAIGGQVPVYVQLREAASSMITWGSTGIQEFIGTGVFTGLDVGSPLDKPADVKFTLKGTAALVKQESTS